MSVTVQRDVMVPMRDGVRLATDFYFPGNHAQARRCSSTARLTAQT